MSLNVCLYCSKIVTAYLSIAICAQAVLSLATKYVVSFSKPLPERQPAAPLTTTRARRPVSATCSMNVRWLLRRRCRIISQRRRIISSSRPTMSATRVRRPALQRCPTQVRMLQLGLRQNLRHLRHQNLRLIHQSLAIASRPVSNSANSLQPSSQSSSQRRRR